MSSGGNAEGEDDMVIDQEDNVEGSDAKTTGDDSRYYYDKEKLNEMKVNSSKTWMRNPKHFAKVAVSPSAIIKIMMHCQSGVEKGVAKGGNPIEVMGMLLGRPDTLNPDGLVVTDAFPLPIEGFETRVVADDIEVTNHMIALGEALEKTRQEKFMGWYHSHPFDLGDRSHCFLSQTDLSTQLQWQRAEDGHGNPFVAIVVDPLRSNHLRAPELKAFRAYPPDYNSPVLNECPDGVVENSEQVRLEHWGSCWNRYYELSIEYFMSSASRQVLEHLTQDYLWIRNLTTPSSTDSDKKLIAASRQFKAANAANVSEFHNDRRTTVSRRRAASRQQNLQQEGYKANRQPKDEALGSLMEAATAQLCEVTLQKTMKQIFAD